MRLVAIVIQVQMIWLHFSTGKRKHSKIKNANDEKLFEFDNALNKVLLNLAKEWLRR